MIYRGVEYSVTATSEPDISQWRFQIGGSTTAGKTRTGWRIWLTPRPYED